MDPYQSYKQKRDRLVKELAEAKAKGETVGLQKSTSNLFRHREKVRKRKIDVRAFNRVLSVDTKNLIADVEGMATYEAIVDETLKHGLLPTVVPQLKSITLGGAVSGLGIESSSFRFGLVHETVTEMEILLADGKTVVCSPKKNADLFYGFPNSYGTLGYALRLKVKLIPAKRYVKLTHTKFTDSKKYFAHIEAICARSRQGHRSPDPSAGFTDPSSAKRLSTKRHAAALSAKKGSAPDQKEINGSAGETAARASSIRFDYIDGAIFSEREMYVTTGEFVDELPSGVKASDYTYMKVFYKSIQTKKTDYLTTRDYIWRWDTDWFWCSKHFYVMNPAVRLLATPWALNSKTYQRIMRLANRVLPKSEGRESVIQDVDIPVEHSPEFFSFLLREIRITPVWICPFQSYDPKDRFDLYALDPKKLYVNFGFWDTRPSDKPEGHYNKLIEAKAFRLKGKKGLYSSAYYDEATFWKIYNKPAYEKLKAKYDPGKVFLGLYEKTVRRK